MSVYQDYERLILDRRNLYWNLYIRACLALVVVMVIAVLISACKVEAQAGLPIITGIISYVIGQSADIMHEAGRQQFVFKPTGDPPSKDITHSTSKPPPKKAHD